MRCKTKKENFLFCFNFLQPRKQLKKSGSVALSVLKLDRNLHKRQSIRETKEKKFTYAGSRHEEHTFWNGRRTDPDTFAGHKKRTAVESRRRDWENEGSGRDGRRGIQREDRGPLGERGWSSREGEKEGTRRDNRGRSCRYTIYLWARRKQRRLDLRPGRREGDGLWSRSRRPLHVGRLGRLGGGRLRRRRRCRARRPLHVRSLRSWRVWRRSRLRRRRRSRLWGDRRLDWQRLRRRGWRRRSMPRCCRRRSMMAGWRRGPMLGGWRRRGSLPRCCRRRRSMMGGGCRLRSSRLALLGQPRSPLLRGEDPRPPCRPRLRGLDPIGSKPHRRGLSSHVLLTPQCGRLGLEVPIQPHPRGLVQAHEGPWGMIAQDLP